MSETVPLAALPGLATPSSGETRPHRGRRQCRLITLRRAAPRLALQDVAPLAMTSTAPISRAVRHIAQTA